MKAKLLAVSIFAAAFGATAHATPTLSGYGTGCPDGFCLWAKGQDFYQTITDLNPANKYDYVYIDVYPDATSPRIGRFFLYQFQDANLGSEQVFSIRFDTPAVQQAMMKGSVYFQIINPESTSQTKWTARTLLQWKRNKVILSEDFQSMPVTSPNTHFGTDRNYIVNGNLNPSGNPILGWFRSAMAFTSRVSTDASNNRYWEARTEVGKWGATNYNGVGGGITFSSAFCQSPPCTNDSGNRNNSLGYEEAFLSYRVNFANCPGLDTSFDFRGGKLPGLAGGSGSVASGGGNGTTGPNGLNGWSARSMFGYADAGATRALGKASLYLYHVDMREPRVIPVPSGGNVAEYHRHALLTDPANLNPPYQEGVKYGHGFPYRNADGSMFNFIPNRWYQVVQRVRMNTYDSATHVGHFNGEVQIWVDGQQKLLVKNLRLRHGKDYGTFPGQTPVPNVENVSKQLDIDGLNFHLFYGGGSNWAPQRNSCASFDDVKVFDKHR